jgi:hypothetical protein
MSHILCNDPVDVQWLVDVHLPKNHPEFKSFELLGNEDAPDKVVLYADVCPTVLDQPIKVYVRDQKGELR